LPPLSTGLVCMVRTAVGELLVSKEPWQSTFNIAQFALAGLAAGFAYHAIGPDTAQPGNLSVVGALVAALAMYLANITLVDMAIGLQLQRNPLEGWWANHREDWSQESAMYLLGALAGLAIDGYPWGGVLVILPAFVVYR